MRPRVLLLLLWAGLLIPASVRAEPDGGPGADLALRARAQSLAEEAVWRALLHMARPPFGLRARSEVPEGPFFLAPNGASDPAAELEATIEGLLRSDLEGDAAVHCRYPARTRWLADALEVPLERLARTPCPAFDEWRSQLAPRGITMIFPEAFMNNPASMFGHTLLRLDVADPESPRNLLAYAIDFTANSQGDAGPVFLAKGVLGLYPGFFALNPYYEKLGFYSEWQSRDIWEYPLALSEGEIERVLLHLWELDAVPIPYYFFRANCSYQLIRLLEVARPGIWLGHGFPLGAIPVDTVRDALRDIGLAGEVRYRPSPAAELRTALDALVEGERQLALALARGERSPDDPSVAELDAAARGRILGAAHAAHRYLFESGEIAGPEARKRSFALLSARSRAAPGRTPSPPRPDVRPDEGHRSALISVSGGVEDDEGFVEVRLRPAFHGTPEPEAGFPGDATIGFLDTRFRYFPSSGRARLHELVLVELQSRSPRDSFFEPLSWGLETGLRTRLFPEDDGELDRRLVWRSGGGVGWTLAPGDGPLRVYAMADARLEVGSGFDGGFALGPGAELGFEITTPRDRWKGRLLGRATTFVAGDRDTHWEAQLGQRLTLTRRTAAVAEAGVHHYAGEAWLEARIELQWTF